MGTMFYGSQPQAIQNAYVTSTEPIPILQQHPLQQQQQTVQRQQQEQEMYRLLLQQFDNLESSLFSPSPIISSCSSSLSNSPYLESPLMAVASDFDLFPMNNAAGTRQAAVSGYPSAPVMAPPSSPTTQAMYSQTGGYHQLTPPTNPIDLESGTCSLFKHDAFSNTQQPMTTELSMLCKCPGKFPCGEQLPTDSIESVSPVGSPLEDIHESDNNESDFGSEEEDQQQELEHDSDPTYVPTHARSTKASRSKSMVINTSVSAPYSSPYSKDPAPSPKTPVRQDKRRSSSGSFSSFGHSHNQQLLDPNMVPEIKDIHVCPVCDRRFTRPFNLRSHLMTHTTARPFPCDECHWKFTRQHDLLRHKRAKHPNSVNTAPTTGQKKTSANKSRSASAA
ncbi:hypothetical protein BCR41DRAFT_361806 [Lobosporangium transversale]|uniref:C2H2-type domain-containing protein n=1 Tax=Lobosporangium transversale TaxID=64571 RepID=A0A1Y2GAJ3_9FUNG|nr:hypothetical protein BCR41DRAFT_361806 [Lobosporangium transversale]ORZ05572.1 hypothetical protein BCR41DRAFT_361806 [Lobosporangium transversale]|eukprot:XP_021877146.1 hypothetical protein BCR41DRAFT_361806 [Lobosporangium transversale]